MQVESDGENHIDRCLDYTKVNKENGMFPKCGDWDQRKFKFSQWVFNFTRITLELWIFTSAGK